MYISFGKHRRMAEMWVGGIWSCVGNEWRYGVYGKGEESFKHEIVGVVEWCTMGTGHWGRWEVGSRESGLLGVCAASDKRATVSGKGG